MDYEKKYKDAMARAKQGLPMNEVFPELVESEDERIRKEIMEYLTVTREKDLVAHPERQRWIAYLEKQKLISNSLKAAGIDVHQDGSVERHTIPYLEKQKEQSPFISAEESLGISSEEYNKIIDECIFGEQKEQKSIKVYDNMDDLIADAMIDEINKSDMSDRDKHNRIYWINKHRQKPAEWSEEDKNIITEVASILINDENRADNKEEEDRLAYLAEKIQSIRPQPKQEWSEEDEAAFGDLMWCIEQARKSAKDENDMGDIWFAENWVKERLKFLRPTPKQEWNEEEKKVLDSIIDDYEKTAKSFCGYDGKIMLLKAIRNGEYGLSKQEWSEEDKNRHYYLCKLLRETWDKVDKGSCIDDAITWLENLPEQIYPHSWKPSKEQMEVLEYYMHALMCTKNKEILFGLYTDLKKL